MAQVRRVLDQIRGRSYEEALILLEYMPFRACEPVLDTLISVRAPPTALEHLLALVCELQILHSTEPVHWDISRWHMHSVLSLALDCSVFMPTGCRQC